MPNYDFTCQDCKHPFRENVQYTKRDEPLACPECGSTNSYRHFPTPAVTKASYPDGTTNRFATLKEASKLNKEAASAKPDRKKEIAKEIRKMGVKLTK